MHRVVNYLTVDGVAPDAIEPAIESVTGVEASRRLPGDNGPDCESTLSGSVFRYRADAGARAKRGAGHTYVKAPAEVDAREVTDAMDERVVGQLGRRARAATD